MVTRVKKHKRSFPKLMTHPIASFDPEVDCLNEQRLHGWIYEMIERGVSDEDIASDFPEHWDYREALELVRDIRSCC